jgi:hypothetical protein
MQRIIRNLATIAAVATMVSAPANAQVIEPTGDWLFSQDAGSCRAFRPFGDGAFLLLRSFGPGSPIEVTVGNPDFPKEPASARLAEIGWDGMELERDQIALLGSTVSGIPTATLVTGNRPVAAFFKGRVDRTTWVLTGIPPAARSLQFRVAGAPMVSLEFGDLETSFKWLTSCEDALLEKWGWGADYMQRIASPPVLLDPRNVSPTIVYPPTAVVGRVGTILQLRLKVDAKGKVSECVAQSPTVTTRFATDTCKTIRSKIRYSPARNAQGDAVDGFAQMAVTFAILN